ncbi:ABC transporter C family member 14-like [Amaranthus tricolor]|uniref:ABC transporter C family member 14-like n=1 Tax=Amaranthus tricolor TaxID=29722 RepID=UPI0025828D7C|nr:ABC transporter C family member 14-like [Amaranthus tricolor]
MMGKLLGSDFMYVLAKWLYNFKISSDSDWVTTLKCSSNDHIIEPSDNFMQVFQWVRFIFLSPCPQRLVFSSINLFFLFILTLFLLHRLISKFFYSRSNTTSSSINKPLLENQTDKILHVKISLWFRFTLISSVLLSVLYLVLGILLFMESKSGIPTSWKQTEFVFRIAQAVTQMAILVLVVHEQRFNAISHPMSLRVYWVAQFLLVFCFSISSITRFVSVHKEMDSYLRMDDVFTLISFPISFFLLLVASQQSSGIIVIRETEHGLDSRTDESIVNDPNISDYGKANLFSKITWLWMNPVINKGYKNPLKFDDVPSLPLDHSAQRMSELFESHWPKPGEHTKHPVAVTLFKCFWKSIAFTGLLAVIKLGVMYVGPVLIQSFVSFTSGMGSSPYEGYYLVFTLLLAKTIEVLSTHQFNFHTQRIGIQIRSTLITALYRKGLKLSCTSRQNHGVGQIVNYMAVDAQQLGDLMNQLHSIWLMPLQLFAALALLYFYMGVATFAAFAGVIAILGFVLYRTKKCNVFQYQVMRNRDSRLKAMNEMINNMRVIKFQAWEDYFSTRIQSCRRLEYKWLSKFAYTVSANMSLLFSTPMILSVIVFGFAIWMGSVLDAATVFTVTTVMKILQEPVRSFPQSLIQISQAMISLGRLDSYMMSPELDEGAVERSEVCHDEIAVEVKHGRFSWEDEAKEETLKGLNLRVKKGELAAIVGTVGSGKSSLLAAILGEMHKISGSVRVCGSTAYVAQTSWIQNATIQENILFGKPMNKEKYKEVLRVCSLEKDLEIMEFGDQTEIGERGINLSGGQKQRVQLARAIYQDSDVYLLDDIFSAVDAHTGSEIFKECVRGAIKDKTILLVTHQVDFLHNADHIFVMRDGMVVQSGKYNELLEEGLDFAALVAAYESSMDLVEMSSHPTEENSEETSKSPLSETKSLERVKSEKKEHDKSNSEKGKSNLIEEEERETGRVSLDVYKKYSTEAYGWWGVAAVVLVSLSWVASLMGSDYWLAYETSEEHTFTPVLLISVYAIVGSIACLFVTARALLITFLGLKTAQSFFNQILDSILHAPMSFFDTTPSGRILNRASTDQTNVDLSIPLFLGMTIVMYFNLVSVVVVTCVYAWPTFLLIVPLVWVNLWYRAYYLANSRELTRLGSITKSPVIHHFSETVSGVMTIRSFRRQTKFCKQNIDKVNTNLKMDFYTYGANEWLGFRLEFIGSVVLCFAALFMIILPSSIIKPEYVGLSLSYGLTLNVVMFWTVYMTCFVENKMVSVERIKQFIRIPSEAPWKIKECTPLPNWPIHGNIEIKDLQVRYRSNTPLVLKGLSLSIRGGEKIGVVGRTGSGKSTLIQVFFRLVEPCGGKIIIDGVDICKMGLHDLRSRFGIIPQEPVLFQGTVRTNVDPLGLYSEEEIWKSLERCQLKEVVVAKPEKLDAPVVDGGENWSVGQRQLMCLGRVMLKKSRILFMDEATASVDSQTDATIQKIIREDFKSCTIITIAHRIPTVMDCDRVLVIDAGWAKEFDKPSRLLERNSLFGALVQEYSNRSSEL